MPYEMKQMVPSLRKGDLQNLQIACMLALGFSGFMRWDDLSNIYVDWIDVLPTHADIFLYTRGKMTSSDRAHGLNLLEQD